MQTNNNDSNSSKHTHAHTHTHTHTHTHLHVGINFGLHTVEISVIQLNLCLNAADSALLLMLVNTG